MNDIQENHTPLLNQNKSLKPFQCVSFTSRYFVFILDIILFLWAIDSGYYNLGIDKFSDFKSYPIDTTNYISFAMGCVLFSFLHPFLPEQLIIPISFLLYLVGTVFFFIHHQHTIISRFLQSISIGYLACLAILCILELALQDRYRSSHFIIFFVYGNYMVGWLFRLFDRTKWLNLYPTLSCILCILAIFVFSSPNLPYRILLRNRKSTKTIHQKDQEKGELTEYLKSKESTLIEVIQAYEIYLPRSADNATSFISAYFKESEGFLTQTTSLYKSLIHSLPRIILYSCCMIFFPYQYFINEIPMVGYSALTILGNGFVVTVILNILILITMISFYCILKNSRSRIILATSSFLLSFCFLCLLIGWFIQNKVIRGWILFCGMCSCVFIFFVGCLPSLLARLYEIIPIVYHAQFIGLLIWILLICWLMYTPLLSLFGKYKLIVCCSLCIILYCWNGFASLSMLDYSTFAVEEVNMLLGYLDYFCLLEDTHYKGFIHLVSL